jgi:hypothetical protein
MTGPKISHLWGFTVLMPWNVKISQKLTQIDLKQLLFKVNILSILSIRNFWIYKNSFASLGGAKFSQIEFVYRNRREKEDPKGEEKKLCEQRSKNDSTLLIFQTMYYKKHCTLRMQYRLSHNASFWVISILLHIDKKKLSWEFQWCIDACCLLLDF